MVKTGEQLVTQFNNLMQQKGVGDSPEETIRLPLKMTPPLANDVQWPDVFQAVAIDRQGKKPIPGKQIPRLLVQKLYDEYPGNRDASAKQWFVGEIVKAIGQLPEAEREATYDEIGRLFSPDQ